MIRFFDIILSLFGLIVSSPLLFIIYLLLLIDNRYPIFTQIRVGKKMKKFKIIKFRTMKLGTSSVATHLINHDQITNLGSFLRKNKLDELPQLFNVVIGEMSLVGPRPCLENQKDLIYYRQKRNVFSAKPGITGLSQIMGVDMSTPEKLAEIDSLMIQKLNIKNYFSIIFQTIFKTLGLK